MSDSTVEAVRQLQSAIYREAVAHGWWDEPRTIGELIALIHSELSEALEDHRNGHRPDEIWFEESGKPCGIGVELADAIIRILDMSEAFGIDMGRLIQIKHRYNKNRPYRHGGKTL